MRKHTGGVGPEPRVSRISWGALSLEAGKSPTEVTCGRHVPRSPPSAISEFASSLSPSWLNSPGGQFELSRPVFSGLYVEN